MLPALAIVLCLAASWFVLSRSSLLARRFGLIDKPNEARKLHAKPTPRIGGLAFIVSLSFVWVFSTAIGGGSDRLLLSCGALVLFHFVLGVIDDRCGIPTAWRLLLSIATCALMLVINDELVIRTLRLSIGSSIEIPPQAAFILTLLGLVFFIFAVNLMDGRNGILGMNALWWLALLQATTSLLPLWVFAAISGTLLLFLRFNLRGVLFAGDSGAYVVGCGIGLLTLTVYARHPAIAADQLMVLFLLPVIDALRVLVRRAWLHLMPFRADNSHLHYVLWRRAGDRDAAVLYTIAIVVPSALAALWPQFSGAFLVGAVSFFFLLIYWPTKARGTVARTWRYIQLADRPLRQFAHSFGREWPKPT
jgi:UDP-GlcNAc:undecaprenyl-phosphate GlcNAc-1-phosphate transferase